MFVVCCACVCKGWHCNGWSSEVTVWVVIRVVMMLRSILWAGFTSISFIEALPPSIERFSWSLRKPKTIGPGKVGVEVSVVVKS